MPWKSGWLLPNVRAGLCRNQLVAGDSVSGAASPLSSIHRRNLHGRPQPCLFRAVASAVRSDMDNDGAALHCGADDPGQSAHPHTSIQWYIFSPSRIVQPPNTCRRRRPETVRTRGAHVRSVQKPQRNRAQGLVPMESTTQGSFESSMSAVPTWRARRSTRAWLAARGARPNSFPYQVVQFVEPKFVSALVEQRTYK